MIYFTESDTTTILEVSPRMLKYWREKNLIPNIKTKKSGKMRYYMYSQSDLLHLSLIKELKEHGLSYDTIANIKTKLKHIYKNFIPSEDDYFLNPFSASANQQILFNKNEILLHLPLVDIIILDEGVWGSYKTWYVINKPRIYTTISLGLLAQQLKKNIQKFYNVE